jgi:hypothetical protein
VRRQDLARYAALGVAGSRAAMGTAMVAAPQPFARVFAGRGARHSGPQLLTRATGGREAALGIGAAIGLLRGRDPKLWTAAQLGADLTDLAATAAVSRDLPRAERRVLLAMAGSATAVLTGALFALRGGSPPADELAGETEQSIPSQRTAEGMGSVVMSGESQDDPASAASQP